jgi:PPK2 family polyphosphate:nucleotide phosphotransferase
MRPHRPYATVFDGSRKLSLDSFDPAATGGLDKKDAADKFETLGREFAELINLMTFARQHALLAVFQGRDASGKDGVIRRVLRFANVLNARVQPFKVPTEEEAAHDFLWRVHQAAPRKGQLVLFNRSHYEDVIAARVHDLVRPAVWKARYEQINGFERLLAASGTIVLKFYLHISRDEQWKRLREREKNPLTAWKLEVSDWRELPLWDETTAAYEEAIKRCSSPELPFYLVPSDHKWFRTVAVLERLVLTLRPYRARWMRALRGVRRSALKEIREIREQVKATIDKQESGKPAAGKKASDKPESRKPAIGKPAS